SLNIREWPLCVPGIVYGCAFPGIVPRSLDTLSTNSFRVVSLASDNFSKIKSSAVGRLLAIIAQARLYGRVNGDDDMPGLSGPSQNHSPNLRPVRTTRPLDHKGRDYQTDPSTPNGLWQRVANALARWPKMVRPFECPGCNSPIIARSARHG